MWRAWGEKKRTRERSLFTAVAMLTTVSPRSCGGGAAVACSAAAHDGADALADADVGDADEAKDATADADDDDDDDSVDADDLLLTVLQMQVLQRVLATMTLRLLKE